jgi:hypothetical protein
MAQGTFSEERTYYYSEALPQGEGSDVGYNPELYKNLQYVLDNFHNLDENNPVSHELMIDAQKNLIDIGYLDPGDDDGWMGPMTMGAIKRYETNFGATHLWNQIKDTITFWN